jgi:hypothetical protein
MPLLGRRAAIAGIWFVIALAFAPMVAVAANWAVVFRADDPKLWNTDAGDLSDDNGFSINLDDAPENIRFLRLTRKDNGQSVIVAIQRKQLHINARLGEDWMWIGGAKARGPEGNKNRLLGIARRSWKTASDKDHLVYRLGGLDSGLKGWGFSKQATTQPDQTYSWEGEPIQKTVFEIAVTGDDLSVEEQGKLLNNDSSILESLKVSTTGSGAPQVSGLQNTITGLYTVEQENGAVTGQASQFVLTATPGQSDTEESVPVSFSTDVRPAMHIVLYDVIRGINLSHGASGLTKIDISFDDKFSTRDTNSTAAAVGTLLLCTVEALNVDPYVAVAGDMGKDAKISAIDGVGLKLTAAGKAGSAIVAIPADDYQQVQDAMVYDGVSAVSGIQVLGFSNLDEAIAIARADRGERLAKAIEQFHGFQQSLKDSPKYLYSADGISQLEDILSLAPNHYSAKLLLLAAEHKIPRLSAAASRYYTVAATNDLMAAVASTQKSDVAQSASAAALAKLAKLRPISDLSVRPYTDDWMEYLSGRTDQKREEILNHAAKMGLTPDVMTKMLEEGI